MKFLIFLGIVLVGVSIYEIAQVESAAIPTPQYSCQKYPPPENGALICHYFGGSRACSVHCKPGFHFEFKPPFTYYCDKGKWKFWSLPGEDSVEKMPWPNCLKTQPPAS